MTEAFDVTIEAGIDVELPSGEHYNVLTTSEEAYVQDRVRRYMSDNKFVNVTDLADVDKIVVFELLIHRFTLWVGRSRNYFDDEINVMQYSAKIQEFSGEVRQLKRALGLDKVTRDKTSGDDSVAARWDNLLQRAKEFGYARNEIYNQIIEAFKRCEGMLIFHDNADEMERKEQHCEAEDVLAVLREAVDQVNAVDEKFRFETQRMWVKDQ